MSIQNLFKKSIVQISGGMKRQAYSSVINKNNNSNIHCCCEKKSLEKMIDVSFSEYSDLLFIKIGWMSQEKCYDKCMTISAIMIDCDDFTPTDDLLLGSLLQERVV